MTAFETAVVTFALTPISLFNTLCVYREYRKAFEHEEWGERAARRLAAAYLLMSYVGILNAWGSCLALLIFFVGLFLGSGGGWKKLKKKLSALRDSMTSIEAATWRREMAEAR